MSSTENIHGTIGYQGKAPSSLNIFFIIILGISGMIGTFQYMLWDLKESGYRKELWTVRDSSRRIDTAKVTTIDSVMVIYHPQFAAHQADLNKERLSAKKNKIPAMVANEKNRLDYTRLYFAYNSVFLVWIAIFSIMVGSSLALLPVILNAIIDIVRMFGLNIRRQMMVILSTLLIGGLIFLAQNTSYLMKPSQILERFDILLKHPLYLDIFIVLCVAIALTAIAGQLFINQAIGKLPDNITGLERGEQIKIAEKFELLRNQLKFFLLIDAALIVLSILNTDAFRRAINAEVSINMDIVPMNYVYLYGVLFTFFLAIIYLPVYYRLRLKGEMMLKEISHCPPESYDHEIVKVLHIRETPVESLKVVISILAPVLTSLVPGLLNI